MVTLIDQPADMQRWADTQRSAGRKIALVPTMGALHAGHLALIDAARAHADSVVVSIFVNPLQFGESTDFEQYPRPIDDDIASCDARGVEVVYAPTASAMYPAQFATMVHVDGLTDQMEGASRPGHFAGVCTVVTKLLAASRPHLAVFGEKDYQQLAIVRRMVADLDLGVEIVGHPTLREADGVAMSSRNRRLHPAERTAARCVPAAIAAAMHHAMHPDATPASTADVAAEVIRREPTATLDYVRVFDPTTLAPLDSFGRDRRSVDGTRIALAVRIGEVRLIDNANLFDEASALGT